MGYIAVIDYGAGNLMSVTNALKFLGYDCKVISHSDGLKQARAMILPGVGAFPAAMRALNASGLVPAIRSEAEKKPLLGICLGMQMLFDKGFEFEPTEGLGLIPGSIRQIETDLKLPHIGWNSLEIQRPSRLLKGVEEGSYVYFVHSFCAVTESEEDLIATADYGEHVAAVVERGNVFGCQFHPEKSGDVGMQMLMNFGAFL